MINDALNWVANVPTSYWVHALELIASGPAISTVLQVIKHYCGLAGEKRFLSFLNAVGSVFAAFAFVHVNGFTLPPGQFAELAALFAGVSKVAYLVTVSPIYLRLVSNTKSAVTGALAPQEPALPVEPNEPGAADFSN